VPTSTIENEFNFGDILDGTQLAHSFHLANHSLDRPLQISNIAATGMCSCRMHVVDDKKLIPPGESAELKVDLPTSGSEGAIVGRFVISTDAVDEELQKVEFVVRANVMVRLKALPAALNFGVVEVGKKSTREFVVQSQLLNLADSFASAICTNSSYSIQLRKAELRRAVFDVTLDDRGALGLHQGRVQVSFRSPSGESNVVYADVIGRVSGPVHAIPATLALSPYANELPQTHKLRVIARDDNPFRIVNVKAPSGIEVDFDSNGQKQKSYDLICHVSTEFIKSRTSDDVISISTDRKDQPSFGIRVVRVRQ